MSSRLTNNNHDKRRDIRLHSSIFLSLSLSLLGYTQEDNNLVEDRMSEISTDLVEVTRVLFNQISHSFIFHPNSTKYFCISPFSSLYTEIHKNPVERISTELDID